MERYKASIESVDTALNRLNQTLASYKLISAEFGKSTESAQESSPPTTAQKVSAGTVPTTKSVPDASKVPAQPQPGAPADGKPPASAPQPDPLKPIERLVCSIRANKRYPEHNVPGSLRLRRIDAAYFHCNDDPYCLPLYLVLAIEFLGLGYPDLASGACYKALLLSDALDNEAEEYHEQASDALKNVIQQQPLEERIQVIRRAMDAELGNQRPSELDPALDVELTLWLRAHYRLILYRLLTRSLLLLGCLKDAMSYSNQAHKLYPNCPELTVIRKAIVDAGERATGRKGARSFDTWPKDGWARREQYPWNEFEPDRLNMIGDLNIMLNDVSDKLEIRAVDLPALGGEQGVITQLGVFARDDIQPGEEILNETSMLTANNKLQDALCDACSADLPPLKGNEDDSVVCCAECEVVFCSQWCYDEAIDSYHTAICGKDVEAIAKDVPPAESADALYALLLLRTFAMAETQDLHPLEVHEVRYTWGDFAPIPNSEKAIYAPFHLNDHSLTAPQDCAVPRKLPFSFEYNVRLPFHILEKMDIDFFSAPQYDVWVFNTLYAKFRGTASARLSGLGGRAIRGPEVSAVHPMWCLANHSCDPNVSWEWGGSIRFTSRENRVAWTGRKGKVIKSQAGIKKGEEILNHYCDVDLPVKERRAWARGALGGDCQCARCVWETKEARKASKMAKSANSTTN